MISLKPSEIRSEIITHFSANYTMTPVEYPPSTFDSTSGSFVSLRYTFGDGYSIIKGDGTYTRHTGLINVGVYVPLVHAGGFLKGSAEAFTIADEVLRVLERTRMNDGSVVTRAGNLETDMQVEKKTGMYYFILVSVPFFVS